MKCVVCGKGKTIRDVTTVRLERDKTTVVHKSVPALICDNCGEVYLEDEIGSQLLTDEALWDAQFAATDDEKVAELVASVEAEISEGRTLPMFDDQGKFREFPFDDQTDFRLEEGE